MAGHWFQDHNKSNRKPSKHIIAKYAQTMREGRWLLTHQGIAFDDLDLLLDGQHRLGAIVLANTPIMMHVSSGISRDTFAVLDTGFKRSAAHLINHPHRIVIAAAARVIGAVTGTLSGSHVSGGVYAGGAENDQTLAIVDDWPELAIYAAAVIRCYKNTGIPGPPHLAIIAEAARTPYRDQIDSWLDGLIEGINLSASDPRRHLAKRFANQRERRALTGAGARRPAYCLIAKAWNAHARHEPMALLRYSDEESVPKIVGYSG
jgi:hypothetical protein